MELPLPHPGPWLASQLTDRFGAANPPDRLAVKGQLVRIRRGAYFDARVWAELSAEERHLAVLAAHYEEMTRRGEPQYTYSHLSAARLHGLHLWNVDGSIHLTMQKCPGRSGRASDVRVHSGVVLPSEQHTLRGLPTTSLERTLVDSTRLMRRGQAQILMDHGLRLGADPSAVANILSHAQGQRGIRIARAAWEMASGLCESPGESLLRLLLTRMPFTMPEQQVEVSTRLGRYRLDFAWVKLKIGLEFDGDVKYFAFGPTAEALVRERKRERALMEEGWILLRIEWRDLFDEAALRGRIAAAIRSAA
ncbi:hypothetical protein [Sinomonas gamaensis]|uniref:hypothetical protein n=1 Tax=Sinomonas gamaensis TaxID=2565624 RepID=UPI00110A0500|nr:hypothetical protein [Sinomonas gamaensis]